MSSLALMWGVVVLVFTGLPALTMGLAYLFGAREWWMLLVCAALGGALPGAFVARAATAMSTAVEPTAALLRGSAIGAALGTVTGALLLGGAYLWRRWRGRAVA